jgi:hypothetical protein
MAKRKRKKKQEPTRVVFETFRKLGFYEVNDLTWEEPSCFNQTVRVHKYRVKVELVEEPVEVLHERLQRLWDHSDNFHDSDPLRAVAEELGYELQGSRGSKCPKRW